MACARSTGMAAKNLGGRRGECQQLRSAGAMRESSCHRTKERYCMTFFFSIGPGPTELVLYCRNELSVSLVRGQRTSGCCAVLCVLCCVVSFLLSPCPLLSKRGVKPRSGRGGYEYRAWRGTERATIVSLYEIFGDVCGVANPNDKQR